MSTLSRTIAATVLWLLIAPYSPAAAQDASGIPVPRVDVSAGYMLMRDTSHERDFPTGWYFSGAVNPNQWFGIVLELGGSYSGTESFTFQEGRSSSKHRVVTALAGPRFFKKVGRVVPFGQFLSGIAVERTESTSVWRDTQHSGSINANRFAIQPGAGLTVYLTESVGVRAAADYLTVMDFEDEAEYTHALRFITGLTFQWGSQ